MPLDFPSKPGSKTTLREELDAVERQTNKIPKRLDIEPLPDAALHIWMWFRDVMSLRSGESLSIVDLDAWIRVMHIQISQEEIKMILKLARVYDRLLGERIGNG